MKCQTDGHQMVEANWYVNEGNVYLIVCTRCAEVGMRMNANVRRLQCRTREDERRGS